MLLIKPYNNSGYSFNFCYKKIIQQTIWVGSENKVGGHEGAGTQLFVDENRVMRLDK